MPFALGHLKPVVDQIMGAQTRGHEGSGADHQVDAAASCKIQDLIPGYLEHGQSNACIRLLPNALDEIQSNRHRGIVIEGDREIALGRAGIESVGRLDKILKPCQQLMQG
ncbi:hypothetical protein NP88_4627 [Burkholderia cepacia]|uniref:Uncharacterized protein n=2 Tax=Pseudomonadota TaxID=1224 RepID=A0A6P2MR30_9BURK|nr:hypothetical protein NP88_4627 [Burkholderia cepacia]SPV00617.1 Uncharacterised protein [Burkholderia cenocepacia]SPV14274.1 Uncharacterised protein [Burkholderia cenocepacia]VWB88230.1 hypothetical protein BPS26883_04243 [Burkholderia pseudomultivorans]